MHFRKPTEFLQLALAKSKSEILAITLNFSGQLKIKQKFQPSIFLLSAVIPLLKPYVLLIIINWNWLHRLP